MDSRKFDDLARCLAQSTSRRRFLTRGAALVTAAGGLFQASPTDAARRGKPPTTAICSPDGAGGYTRLVVPNVVLPAHLAAGAVRDNGCCSAIDCPGDSTCSSGVCDVQTGACEVIYLADDTECTPDGPIDLCRNPYTCQQGVCTPGIQLLCAEVGGGCERSAGCNPATGQCDYVNAEEGTSCNRESGCVPGTCAAGVCLNPPPRICLSDSCRICSYNACSDSCGCFHIACGVDFPDCQTGVCDPVLGCVYTNVNEDGPCTREEEPGFCVEGVCLFFK